jgi:hypothetical protein
MMFSEALTQLYNSGEVKRDGWSNKGLSIKIVLDPRCSNGQWIGMYQEGKLICPWTASQSDLLGDDWTPVYNDRRAR